MSTPTTRSTSTGTPTATPAPPTLQATSEDRAVFSSQINLGNFNAKEEPK
jgi:hypothetical protein